MLRRNAPVVKSVESVLRLEGSLWWEGRYKFIKISSPKMIFHTVHCHSIADSLCLKCLVWVEYQLHGFHDNEHASRRQLYVNKENGFDERGPDFD